MTTSFKHSDDRESAAQSTNNDQEVNESPVHVGASSVTRMHNLAELRKLRNMTQVEVARIMGNTQPSVSAAERAPEVSLVHVQRYARALGLEMEVTFYAEGKVVKSWRT